VPQGQALQRALEVAAALSTYPQTSLRNDRRAVLGGLALPLEEGLVFEADVHKSSLADPQVAEWLRRFAAGERPQPLRPPEG
jgi:enoyl-CoA hydratase